MRKIFNLVFAATFAIAIAGCGSSDNSTDTTTTNMSGMDMSRTTATSTGTGTSTDASVVDVKIQNFAFSPSTITVKAGTTVRWTNMDSATHTVTSGANRTADNMFDHSMPQGETFEYKFATAGTYDYFCKPHSNMNAKVIVQ
jgi:plastocyanin